MGQWDIQKFCRLKGRSLGDTGCVLVHITSWAVVHCFQEGMTFFGGSAARDCGLSPRPCYLDHFPELLGRPFEDTDPEGAFAKVNRCRNSWTFFSRNSTVRARFFICSCWFSSCASVRLRETWSYSTDRFTTSLDS
ncbi:hypothetical protein R1flu_010641 [Riccia fluitans]|uniref:Uncharacterized protein n=1 Tax=Riccia fluitans TaxID=41844 RepID=A0ABD1Z814_9MARC